GIPTKSEQADLDIALYGLHGDAPHLVFAPLSIRDCVFTTQWAVQLAEHLQTISVVLSDQSLGQSQAIIETPPVSDMPWRRAIEEVPDADYMRYRVTADSISPMTLPGTPGGMYTADGLEHNERGTPSSMAVDHREQLNKRLNKLEEFDYGDDWAEIEGQGDACIITWGSSTGVVKEARNKLRRQSRDIRIIAIRLLAPLQKQKLSRAIGGADRVLVVEQNHSGQLFRYLRAQGVLPKQAESLAQPGPLPLRSGRIIRSLTAKDA
ncbi:MAG: transketolase C-terminal domain-containing protein, partial [Candidatus Thiodiazotropha sp.]